MHLRWEGDRALADAELVAALYQVSVRSVRRHCTPVHRYPPAGPGSVQAEYDAFTAETELAPVNPRPSRRLAALRERVAVHARIEDRHPLTKTYPTGDDTDGRMSA